MNRSLVVNLQDTDYSHVRHFALSSKWVLDADSRLDATTYAQEGYEALRTLEHSKFTSDPLSKFVGRVYHPTESQPRSNFKRIWVGPNDGPPFLTGRQLFFFRPDRDKFISRKMRKLDELKVPERTILLSRSGTTGHPVLVGRWLSRFAVTDDAIRIFEGTSPIGFVYAYLASSIGRPLLVKSEYGSTVSHLEAKHVYTVPVPNFSSAQQQSIHEKILRAYNLRDQANEFLDQAETRLYELLGIDAFSEKDIEYLGPEDGPKAFVVSSTAVFDRVDATQHVPVVRSVIHKLERGKFPIVKLAMICSEITIPARFKRNYAETNTGVPYLLPSLLATIRFTGLKRLSEKQAKETPEYLLEEGKLLLTTDGTIGRVHPVTKRMVGWFGSNNIARLWDVRTDMGFLYAFLSTPYGRHQLTKDIYGGVVDHINESHIGDVLVPKVPPSQQPLVGDLVREGFACKDEANRVEDEAIEELERLLRNA